MVQVRTHLQFLPPCTPYTWSGAGETVSYICRSSVLTVVIAANAAPDGASSRRFRPFPPCRGRRRRWTIADGMARREGADHFRRRRGRLEGRPLSLPFPPEVLSCSFSLRPPAPTLPCAPPRNFIQSGSSHALDPDAAAGAGDASLLPPHSHLAGSVEQVSWKPKAYVFHGFLTDEECDHLIKRATPKMEKSTVVDSSTGKSVPSEIRTSSGMFFSRFELGNARHKSQPNFVKRQTLTLHASVPHSGIYVVPYFPEYSLPQGRGRGHPPHRGAHRGVHPHTRRERRGHPGGVQNRWPRRPC